MVKHSTSVLSITLAALLSGLVCYRIGVFKSCSSQFMWTHFQDDVVPQRSTKTTTQSTDNGDVLTPSNSHDEDSNEERRFVQRPSSLPYNCGKSGTIVYQYCYHTCAPFFFISPPGQ